MWLISRHMCRKEKIVKTYFLPLASNGIENWYFSFLLIFQIFFYIRKSSLCILFIEKCLSVWKTLEICLWYKHNLIESNLNDRLWLVTIQWYLQKSKSWILGTFITEVLYGKSQCLIISLCSQFISFSFKSP